MPLLWLNTNSSAIKQVGYDPLNGDLRIVFRPRATAYLWRNVGLSVVMAMLEANSLGAWVGRHLVGHGQGIENSKFAQQQGFNVDDAKGFIDALVDLGFSG